MEKKGQASLIVIILIILISLVAIFILWNVVGSLIKEKSEDVEISSLTVNLEVKEVIVFVGGASKITVNRKSGFGEIDELRFIFYDGSGLNHIEIINENILKELETKTYYFGPPKNIGKIKKVSVVSVIGDNIGREFESDINEVLEVPRGLVSWWRFSDINDFVGENNGRLENVKIEDEILVLDGAGFFDVGNDSSLSMNKDVAISFWIKPDLSKGSIIKKGSLDENYHVFLNDVGEVVFSYGGEDKFIKSYVKIPNSEWSHVVISVDWNGLYKIFINGEESSYFDERNVVPNINSERVLIGKDFKGSIDEVMIFNKSLTKNNANFLYNTIKSS